MDCGPGADTQGISPAAPQGRPGAGRGRAAVSGPAARRGAPAALARRAGPPRRGRNATLPELHAVPTVRARTACRGAASNDRAWRVRTCSGKAAVAGRCTDAWTGPVSSPPGRSGPASRAHVETVTDTEGRTHDIRLGVFRSDTPQSSQTAQQTAQAHPSIGPTRCTRPGCRRDRKPARRQTPPSTARVRPAAGYSDHCRGNSQRGGQLLQQGHGALRRGDMTWSAPPRAAGPGAPSAAAPRFRSSDAAAAARPAAGRVRRAGRSAFPVRCRRR